MLSTPSSPCPPGGRGGTRLPREGSTSPQIGRDITVSADGIEAVYLQTHNWGKAAKFCQSLDFTFGLPAGVVSVRIGSAVGGGTSCGSLVAAEAAKRMEA